MEGLKELVGDVEGVVVGVLVPEDEHDEDEGTSTGEEKS